MEAGQVKRVKAVQFVRPEGEQRLKSGRWRPAQQKRHLYTAVTNISAASERTSLTQDKPGYLSSASE